ncbi:MAG: ribonuclease H-like domain-containing protein [Candidatus Aminicenantes bacterium]|jgi:uncharacterized protein YprB with RNaseH-like and TPR domain
MTDIKDKLKHLKKEREARSRTQKIKDTWAKIDEDEEALSTKEKLEQLITLSRREKSPIPRTPQFDSQEREPLQFIENPYNLETRYGKIKISSGLQISGEILACLSKDDAFLGLDLSTALFIDLETTGLSGGTGTIPFNVGMGYYRDEKFWVGQYFLGDLSEEERMIQEMAQFFEEMNFQSVVTYNGKNFDIPLLETRFILHRQPFPLSGLPHLDFMYPARNLWKHKYDNCRLSYLALEVVRTGRTEDIPSAEVPWRYFQYLQTGNYDLIEPVLYHNQEDILSLLGVVIAGASIFVEEGEECLGDAMDFYGAGNVLEKIGDTERSVQFYEKALSGNLSADVTTMAKMKLSYFFKRNQDWDKAVAIWREITSLENITAGHLFSFRELAMYLEHREKNYEEAIKVAEEGYVLSRGVSVYYEQDFEHRRARLKQKIKKQSAK